MTRRNRRNTRTTPEIRRAVQRSRASVRALAKRYGISPNTVQKWRKRSTTLDAPRSNKRGGSGVLSPIDQAMILAVRRVMLLPLDDCLRALRPWIPKITRPTLHRFFQRQGISRLPMLRGGKRQSKDAEAKSVGRIDIRIEDLSTDKAPLYLFVASDDRSGFFFARVFADASIVSAAAFLDAVVAAAPHKLHTVLTDDSIAFSDLARKANDTGNIRRGHPFDRACWRHNIEHQLVNRGATWSREQIERHHATLIDALESVYPPERRKLLQQHVQLFVDTYNKDGLRLKRASRST